MGILSSMATHNCATQDSPHHHYTNTTMTGPAGQGVAWAIDVNHGMVRRRHPFPHAVKVVLGGAIAAVRAPLALALCILH